MFIGELNRALSDTLWWQREQLLVQRRKQEVCPFWLSVKCCCHGDLIAGELTFNFPLSIYMFRLSQIIQTYFKTSGCWIEDRALPARHSNANANANFRILMESFNRTTEVLHWVTSCYHKPLCNYVCFFSRLQACSFYYMSLL